MARSLSEMNPMISVSAKSVKSEEPSEEIVQGFNLVLVVGKPLGSLIPWNKLCRQKGIAFLAAISRGTQALFFQDAGEHSFQPPVSLPLKLSNSQFSYPNYFCATDYHKYQD